MTESNDHIARCKSCNRIVGIASETMPPKDLAKTVSDWIRKGLSVERIGIQAAKAETWGHITDCPFDPRGVKGKLK